EAKLLGKGMGINPFLMLLSIYVGIHLFGAAGILLGPLGTVLIQTFMSENSGQD
ncbi:MAG: AI-2E family transporter, partial [Lachnospiraceae bacterium]|nr:AI-2E family transporter [Lachnospiraceae bacterium]